MSKILTEHGRRLVANSVLVAVLVVIVYSGFAYPLNYGRGFWPWNRQWFMFSYDTGTDFLIKAESEDADGKPVTLDLSPYFRVEIGREGDRFQEGPRDVENMLRLAGYLCTKFSVPWVSINEYYWTRPVVGRIKFHEVPADKISSYTWVNRRPCGT